MHSDATALKEMNLYFNTQPLDDDPAAVNCPDAIARHVMSCVRLKMGSHLCRKGKGEVSIEVSQSWHDAATAAYPWERKHIQAKRG